MLPRTSGGAKPGIVGHVHHPIRPVCLVDDLTWENCLITNQRSDRRHPGNAQSLWTGTRRKAAARHELDTDLRPTGLIFAKWHQMPLIVERGDRTRAGHRKQRIARTVVLVEPHGTGQYRLVMAGGRDRLERRSVQQERARGLRPNHDALDRGRPLARRRR